MPADGLKFVSPPAVICRINRLNISNYMDDNNKVLPDVSWNPEKGEVYYFIDDHGYVNEKVWEDIGDDIYRPGFMGVYKNREDAQKVVEAIKDLLGK